MTRLANKGSALSKIGLALALFGGLMLGGAQVVAHASNDLVDDIDIGDNGDFLVNYFLNAGIAGSDDVLTLVNGNGEVPLENQTPTQVSPDDFVPICANVYLFDREEEEIGCCSAQISAGGEARLPINELVAGLTPGGSGLANTGAIKVVATNAQTSVVFVPNKLNPSGPPLPFAVPLPCAAHGAQVGFLAEFTDEADSTFGTAFALHGWITHTHSTTITGGPAATFVSETALVDADESEDDLTNLSGNCLSAPISCCAVPGVVGAGGFCS